MIGRVEATIEVRAEAGGVFAAMVDLPSQDHWILGTTLFALQSDVPVPDVGSKIAALTGLAGVGVLDTMTVTVYDPPYRWETEHTGAFKGRGVFRVEPLPIGSRVTWTEEIELPLGLLGAVGFALARPVVRWGLRVSLRRLARGVLDGSLPVAPSRSEVRPSSRMDGEQG